MKHAELPEYNESNDPRSIREPTLGGKLGLIADNGTEYQMNGC